MVDFAEESAKAVVFVRGVVGRVLVQECGVANAGAGHGGEDDW